MTPDFKARYEKNRLEHEARMLLLGDNHLWGKKEKEVKSYKWGATTREHPFRVKKMPDQIDTAPEIIEAIKRLLISEFKCDIRRINVKGGAGQPLIITVPTKNFDAIWQASQKFKEAVSGESKVVWTEFLETRGFDRLFLESIVNPKTDWIQLGQEENERFHFLRFDLIAFKMDFQQFERNLKRLCQSLDIKYDDTPDAKIRSGWFAQDHGDGRINLTIPAAQFAANMDRARERLESIKSRATELT